MTIETHKLALQTKHAVLEKEIAEEIHRPAPDDRRLHELKRQKLLIKEKLEALQRS